MKRRSFLFRIGGFVLLSFLLVSPAWSGMGNMAMNHGLLPSDIASAQALSLFNPKVSATYYNPAYLVHDRRGELTGALSHAEHELRVESQGGNNPPDRSGDVLEDTPSQNVMIGMKTDLSDLTKNNHPIYFGFIAGVDDYGREMLAFQSKTSKKGQFFSHGAQPLFLNLGGGTKLWRGIDAGLSMLITLENRAELVSTSDLSGNTEQESLTVSAQPSFSGIFGINADWGETLCPEGGCWFGNLETALTYRHDNNTSTEADTRTVVPGTLPPPGLPLVVATIDAYQPPVIAAGIAWKNDRWRLGLTLEQQRWSELEEEFEDDTIKDQADWKFDDIVIPRLGMEYRIDDHYTFISGIAFRESPLANDRSLDVNYLDNDQWTLGLGVSASFEDPWLLAYPVQLDLGYQYQRLDERDFELTSSDESPQHYETVTADGEVHVLAGSITLKF